MLTQQRRQDLENAGFCIGDYYDFLELTPEEIELLDFKYRGFQAKLEYDYDCGLWCGKVLMTDSPDIITFKGNSILESYKAFKDSVDDYLEMCKEY